MNVQDRVFSKKALVFFEKIVGQGLIKPAVVLAGQKLPKDKNFYPSTTIKMKRRGM